MAVELTPVEEALHRFVRAQALEVIDQGNERGWGAAVNHFQLVWGYYLASVPEWRIFFIDHVKVLLQLYECTPDPNFVNHLDFHRNIS